MNSKISLTLIFLFNFIIISNADIIELFDIASTNSNPVENDDISKNDSLKYYSGILTSGWRTINTSRTNIEITTNSTATLKFICSF